MTSAAETPDQRRARKLAAITCPKEIEGWMDQAQRDGDVSSYEAARVRGLELRKGAK